LHCSVHGRFPALAINASFRHHLGIGGVGAKSAGAFSGPRLILDHAGNKRCRLVTRFVAEETRLWGKMIAKAHIKMEQGKPWVRSRTVANDPGSPRHGNRTALISLGIPKLVRFHKIRPQQPFYGILIPSGVQPSGAPSRTHGWRACAATARRVPWRFECKFFTALAGF
jgi:hypothetical protein